MKKIDLITLILAVAGSLAFGLGMSMALVEEWNMLKEGIVVGAAGLVIFLIMVLVRRKMQGKKLVNISLKSAGYALYIFVSLLMFGSGLSMVLVLKQHMVLGIIFGIAGMAMLIALIPMLTNKK